MIFLGLSGFSSCSSDGDKFLSENGMGVLSFDIDTDISYKTKAVNEDEYQNVDNYIVDILNGGTVTKTFKYSEMPTKVELGTGEYSIKAHMGEDDPASTTGMYAEGTSSFSIKKGEVTEVAVMCQPVCAKILMEYDPTMGDYFSNYGVEFQTVAIGTDKKFSLADKKTDPVYLRVSKDENIKVFIKMTKKSDGSTAISSTSHKVSPLTALTLKVKPTIVQGNLGITITIDDSTNDKDVTVEIPSDWVNAIN